MKNNFINMLKPTPEPKSTKCKLIAFLVRVFLQFTTPLSGLIAWYFYDYFIAIAVLLLSFIIMGIIRSKLRNSSIPSSQQEYHYNDKGIANWYVRKEFCLEEWEDE